MSISDNEDRLRLLRERWGPFHRVPTRSLTAPAEPEAGEWILRCFECGAKNIIEIFRRHRRQPVLAIAGWRD